MTAPPIQRTETGNLPVCGDVPIALSADVSTFAITATGERSLKDAVGNVTNFV